MIKRFLLSRKTVITLIVLLLLFVLISYVIPQRFNSSNLEINRWLSEHPYLSPAVERLGLDHVYTTPWFAGVLALFLLSLFFSSYEQVRMALKKTFKTGVASGVLSHEVRNNEKNINSVLVGSGYRRIRGNRSIKRFVKHPWGYWGGALFHLGLSISILASLVVVLTEKRGLVYLVEGEAFQPGKRWDLVSTGLLGGELKLPFTVLMKRVKPEFWDTDDLKQVTTEIRLIGDNGAFTDASIAINNTMNYKGFKIYQGKVFGHAFFVEFQEEGGVGFKTMLLIKIPPKRNMPSYEDFSPPDFPYVVQAKYFTDVSRAVMDGPNPELTLRLLKGREILGKTTLTVGQEGTLGNYRIRLFDVRRWASIIFVKSKGMPGVFLGFFVIILGGIFYYFTPPREIYVKPVEDGIFVLTWRCSRFRDEYVEEFDMIKERIEI